MAIETSATTLVPATIDRPRPASLSKVWYSAYQPSLFPPLYIFERVARVHYWAVLDQAQFDRSHVQVKLVQGATPFQMTPSLVGAGRKAFNDIEIDNPKFFFQKFDKSIRMAYGRTKAFQALRPQWDALIDTLVETSDLTAACQLTFEWTLQALGINVQVFHSSYFKDPRPEDPTEWILNLGRAVGATDYMQGRKGIESYFKVDLAKEQGVKVWVQRFSAPSPDLFPNLSILHNLFRVGPDGLVSALNISMGPGNWGSMEEVRCDSRGT